MDAADLEKKNEEEARRHALYPEFKIFKSTLQDEIAGADKALAEDMKKRSQIIKREIEEARIAEEAARNAAEAARIAEADAARIAAVKARIKAEMQAEENERNEKWWKGNSVSDSEFSLRFPGGGRRENRKSKRIIKMKNAKNKSKSKSKSQSRRQRQKRRRHSRRV